MVKNLLFTIVFCSLILGTAHVLCGNTTTLIQLLAVEEEGGTAIALGSDDEYTEVQTAWNAGAICTYDGDDLTATATGTLIKGYFRIDGSDSDDSRLVIYQNNSLVAYSDDRASVSAGWNEYTFSGAQQVTITNGQSYNPGFHAEHSFSYYADENTGTHSGNKTFGDGAPETKDWSGWDSDGGYMNMYFVVQQ